MLRKMEGLESYERQQLQAAQEEEWQLLVHELLYGKESIIADFRSRLTEEPRASSLMDGRGHCCGNNIWQCIVFALCLCFIFLCSNKIYLAMFLFVPPGFFLAEGQPPPSRSGCLGAQLYQFLAKMP
jgi:hypothetical protein